jgi:hypothetical protein
LEQTTGSWNGLSWVSQLPLLNTSSNKFLLANASNLNAALAGTQNYSTTDKNLLASLATGSNFLIIPTVGRISDIKLAAQPGSQAVMSGLPGSYAALDPIASTV